MSDARQFGQQLGSIITNIQGRIISCSGLQYLRGIGIGGSRSSEMRVNASLRALIGFTRGSDGGGLRARRGTMFGDQCFDR